MKKEDRFYNAIGKLTCIVGMAVMYVIPMLYAITN